VNAEARRLLGELLLTPRTLALGVLVDGAPHLGLVPFALADDRRAAYVHVSRLARHSLGLEDGAPMAVLLHAPESPGTDPAELPRLSLSGVAEPLLQGHPEYPSARAAYLGRFPGLEVTFTLADFRLVALRFREGRLVGGFARAYDVTPADLAAAGT